MGAHIHGHQAGFYSDSSDGSHVCPALGLAWANQLLMRLMAERFHGAQAIPGHPARSLRVLFAPHLPPSSCAYTISSEGVRGTPGVVSS